MARKQSREEWKTYGGVFDNFTIANLQKLSAQGHFEEIERTLALGKEANIFLARNKDGNLITIKIYRLENCDFNKMYTYIAQDPRYDMLKGSRRRIIFEWTKREYRNLQNARERIKVPTPFAVKDNIILMEYVEEDGNPAPKLKDASIDNPQSFFEKVVKQMKLLHDHGMVHGDLSAFNILVKNQEPVFIDFSQATMTTSPQARELLVRDVRNMTTYFKKLKLDVDNNEIYKTITGKEHPPEDL